MSSKSNLSLELIYYVYIFIDPRSGLPFYVGKGKGDRWKYHLLKSSLRDGSLKSQTILLLKVLGLSPVVHFYVLDVTEETALTVEAALIIKYGRIDIETGILTNRTDGLDGGYQHTEEAKQKMSFPRPKTAEWIRNHSESLIGRKASDDVKRKISAAHSGKRKSESHKENISKSKTKEKNPMSLSIKIYNELGDLIFESFGDFKGFCNSHDLPYTAFYNSYRKKEKLYSERNPINPDWMKYKGWFAVVHEKNQHQISQHDTSQSQALFSP